MCPHGSSSCRGCCCFATRRRAHAVRHARTWSPARVATPALRSHEEEHVGDRAAEERQRHHAVHLVAARCIFAISEACVADIKRAICAAGRNWSSGHGHSNAELLPPFISNAPPSMDAGTVYKVYMGRHVHFPWCNQRAAHQLRSTTNTCAWHAMLARLKEIYASRASAGPRAIHVSLVLVGGPRSWRGPPHVPDMMPPLRTRRVPPARTHVPQ